MFGRTWTESEIEVLRRDYPTSTAIELARRLGRTIPSVRGAIGKLGLERCHKAVIDEAFLARLRELNAAGWTDIDIAAELDAERHTVSDHRKRLGLPCHMYGEIVRTRVKARTKAQCDAAGVSSLGEYRALMFRVRAVKAGWPPDVRWRAVQILELLETRGPQTREQIAEAIGLPWRGSRKSLLSNDKEGSYLAHLIQRGLVISLGRIVSRPGIGKSVKLYALALGAERRRCSTEDADNGERNPHEKGAVQCPRE
jgi:hypothetical protein